MRPILPKDFKKGKVTLVKILGIDPGLETVGFAFLEDKKLIDFGVIKTSSGDQTPARLHDIFVDFTELLNEFSPDIIAIEKLFFVQNVTNGIAVAGARGVLLLVAFQKGVSILEVSPKDAKLAVCGSGNAPKSQIQKAVQKIFGLPNPPQPDDAADAIAIAYWASGQKLR